MHKRVAFDFDGVFHTQVLLPCIEKQPHPSIKNTFIPVGARYISIPNTQQPTHWSSNIIHLVKTYHKEGYEVYIVTARNINMQETIHDWITQILGANIIPIQNILVGRLNKAETILYLQPEAFYDDSPCHIEEIQKVRKYLPSTFKLYLVIPEKNMNVSVPP